MKSKSIKANKCPRLPYFTLLMLGLTVGLTVDSYPFNFAVTLCRFGNPCESWKKILEGERLSKPSDVSWLFFSITCRLIRFFFQLSRLFAGFDDFLFVTCFERKGR